MGSWWWWPVLQFLLILIIIIALTNANICSGSPSSICLLRVCVWVVVHTFNMCAIAVHRAIWIVSLSRYTWPTIHSFGSCAALYFDDIAIRYVNRVHIYRFPSRIWTRAPSRKEFVKAIVSHLCESFLNGAENTHFPFGMISCGVRSFNCHLTVDHA